MERDFNRNRSSYRPRRSDSREDYQASKTERSERTVYGDRRVRKAGTDRREYTSGDRRPRNAEGERGSTYERTTRFSPNRESRPYSGKYQRRDDRNPSESRISRDDRERRPRIIKREGGPSWERHTPNREEKREYRDRNDRRTYSTDRNKRPISGESKEELRQKHYSKKKILQHRLKNEDENAELRLNRFISMGGVCSRRDADELIVTGRVKVNGVVVQTVGTKVYKKDKVEVDGVQIFPEKKVYLVLNKPKDYVTTVEDPLERKTVMSLIEGACKERIYPVGRLDRQTTGVLLFTNDGDLAKKLTHPKYDHKKIYHVFLDKPLEEKDLEAVAAGVELEDGFIKADDINYTSPDRTEVGIEIHSGKNRIVRRIFEHFGYQIIKLDRVYFAGITKKNVPRGKWRFLTSREVNMLKVY